MSHTGYDAFLAQYSPLLTQLADANWTINEAYTRFSTLFPEVETDHLLAAFSSGKWVFTGHKQQPLNNMMMAAALWYAIGYTLDLEPDSAYTLLRLEQAFITDVSHSFATAGLSKKSIATVMATIGAALKYLAERPYTTLEESAYDELVADPPSYLDELDAEILSWPPARYVLEERVGESSWDTALMRVGICPLGLIDQDIDIDGSTLTDRIFRNALGDFLSYCIRYDRRPAMLLYGAWSTSDSHLGKVPLLSAIRGKYGTWYDALFRGRALINDALQMSASSALPVSYKVDETKTAPQDFSAHGIGIIQAASKEEHNLWEDLNQVMFKEFSAIPWGGALRLYYTETPEQADQPLMLCAKVMRTHAGYLCEINEYDDSRDEFINVNEEYLLEAGWREPCNGYDTWTQNFFSVADAAYYVVGAMRDGLGCTNRYGYFSESSADSQNASRALHPSAGKAAYLNVVKMEDSGKD